MVGSLLVALAILHALPGNPAQAGAAPASTVNARFQTAGAPARFAEILSIVRDSNAPSLIGARTWSDLVQAHWGAIEHCHTHQAFGSAVNRLLGDSGISHFAYFTENDWHFWFLRSAFSEDGKANHIGQIGVMPQHIEGRWFVRGILEGSAPDVGVLRVGDELIAVDSAPYTPVHSFRDAAGRTVRLTVRRRPDLLLHLEIAPVFGSLYRAVREAMHRSVRVFEHEGMRVAYMHVWMLMDVGPAFDRLAGLQEAADGLILDFRDGFGGHVEPALRFLIGNHHDNSGIDDDPTWKKPVIILTGSGTRSAKEIVVYAVKRARRGPLVGEPTPGDVTSVGGVTMVGEDGLLMLPGQRLSLEGKPTFPDYLIRRDIRYSAGADPQMDFAKQLLAQLVRERLGSTMAP